MKKSIIILIIIITLIIGIIIGTLVGKNMNVTNDEVKVDTNNENSNQKSLIPIENIEIFNNKSINSDVCTVYPQYGYILSNKEQISSSKIDISKINGKIIKEVETTFYQGSFRYTLFLTDLGEVYYCREDFSDIIKIEGISGVKELIGIVETDVIYNKNISALTKFTVGSVLAVLENNQAYDLREYIE